MRISKNWSKTDIETAQEIVSLGFPAIEKYYDQIFGSVGDIEALNWPISKDVILPFLIQSRDKIIPELKRRFAKALTTRNVDALYCYISRILYYWDRNLVNQFRNELHDTIRLGPVQNEEHDAEALFLMLAQGIPLEPDVFAKEQDVKNRHPAVAERYALYKVTDTL